MDARVHAIGGTGAGSQESGLARCFPPPEAARASRQDRLDIADTSVPILLDGDIDTEAGMANLTRLASLMVPDGQVASRAAAPAASAATAATVPGDADGLLRALVDSADSLPPHARADAIVLLRSRLQTLLPHSPAEPQMLERLAAGTANAGDAALLRAAVSPPSVTVLVAAAEGGRQTAGGQPGAAPAGLPPPEDIASATVTPLRFEPGPFRNWPTAALLGLAAGDLRDPPRLASILVELEWRASLPRDGRFEERRKWLGEFRHGRLAEEDSLRILGLLPRTVIELLPQLSSTPRLPASANLLASLELLAHGALGGWLTGQTNANCRMLIKKLLLRRAWDRKGTAAPPPRDAIDAFIDAVGPGRDARREWEPLARQWRD